MSEQVLYMFLESVLALLETGNTERAIELIKEILNEAQQKAR